jgi:TonB family protein
MQCSNCGTQLRPDMKFCTKCGAAAPYAPAPAPAAPQPVVSFGDAPRPPLAGSSMGQPQRKSGCGKILLILSLVGVLALAGIGVAVYYGYKYAVAQLKSSEAYTVAMKALKESPAVAEQLGEIKETGFPLGSFHEDANGARSADFRTFVTGTKANGNYDAVLTRRHGKWYLMTGKLTLANGDVINVKSSAEDILSGDNPTMDGNDNADVPPPPAPLPPGQKPQGRVVSGGVLNGKATSKPEPAYPPIAKAARASGTVTVAVVVDETGKVVSARVVSGHPLLQQAATQAAYQARFSPTLLSGQPVKVSGIITYNFVLQ